MSSCRPMQINEYSCFRNYIRALRNVNCIDTFCSRDFLDSLYYSFGIERVSISRWTADKKFIDIVGGSKDNPKNSKADYVEMLSEDPFPHAINRFATDTRLYTFRNSDVLRSETEIKKYKSICKAFDQNYSFAIVFDCLHLVIQKRGMCDFNSAEMAILSHIAELTYQRYKTIKRNTVLSRIGMKDVKNNKFVQFHELQEVFDWNMFTSLADDRFEEIKIVPVEDHTYEDVCYVIDVKKGIKPVDTHGGKCMHKESSEEFSLTAQEQKIAERIIQGRSVSQVAEDLFISIHTVRTHIKNIYRKLGINNQRELLLHYKSNAF